MSNPSELTRPRPLRLSLADVGAGRLAELGLMIAGYDVRNGTVRLVAREELPCGHPAVGLRANQNGGTYCLACRRMDPPARRIKPVGAPAEDEG